MDANELRDAAERLMNLGPSNMSGYDHDYYGLTRVGREQIERDGKRVAAAWRAEHDPTPLTLDIVRTYAEREYDEGEECLVFEMELSCYVREPFKDSHWFCGGIELPACLIPETVGELRQTAAKCGFSLKEP
jgi:hypothetical protein